MTARYRVRSEDATNPGEHSFVCQTCAVESIPVGQSRLMTDTWSGTSWRIWRQTATTGHAVSVRLDARKRVTEAYGHPLNVVIDPASHTGHQTPPVDVINELATVASVERFLKEVRTNG
jgi:hypothetical protein